MKKITVLRDHMVFLLITKSRKQKLESYISSCPQMVTVGRQWILDLRVEFPEFGGVRTKKRPSISRKGCVLYSYTSKGVRRKEEEDENRKMEEEGKKGIHFPKGTWHKCPRKFGKLVVHDGKHWSMRRDVQQEYNKYSSCERCYECSGRIRKKYDSIRVERQV